MNNFGCFAFLIVQNLPSPIGTTTAWMNWAMVVATVASLLVIVPLDEQQRRMMVDEGMG